jgi:serine/threonine protein phosphatase PrpC
MHPPYSVESFGISDLGLVRSNNEDVFHEIPLHRFFVLADGMGGHNAGEIAAKEVVHHLSTSVCQFFSSQENYYEDLPSQLHQAILKANLWVHALSEQKKELSGMGTTLCCLLLHQESLIYAHVGDSRIYRFRESLQQLTEDHSPLNAPPTANKNIITRAIGTNPSVEPDISLSKVEPGDIYFLCSDGLTDFVSDEELCDILNKNHSCIKTTSQRMIESAKNKGGSDNITVLMIKIIHDSQEDLPR